MRPSSTRRAGFILVWILLTVALLAILAAVVAPSVASMVDRNRAEATATILRQISTGILTFESTVHSGSGSSNNFPGQVSQLSTVVGTVPDNNSCGFSMTTRDSTDWLANGPFVPMYIPLGGLWTPIGRIADDIQPRIATGALYILIPGVDSVVAALLDQVVDHGALNTDTVSATHAVINDTTTVTWRVISASLGSSINKC